MGEQHSSSFAYVVYVRRTGERYRSRVGTSKKNTFAIIMMWVYIHSGSQRITSGMFAHSLVRRMLNKQLLAFVGIRLSPACLVRVCVQMWMRLNTFPFTISVELTLTFTFLLKSYSHSKSYYYSIHTHTHNHIYSLGLSTQAHNQTHTHTFTWTHS